MKKCQACGIDAADEMLTCSACGEASWALSAEPAPKPSKRTSERPPPSRKNDRGDK